MTWFTCFEVFLVKYLNLKYIQNLAFSKQLSEMCESILTMYDRDNMFLQSVDSFKICSIGTSPGYISCISVINDLFLVQIMLKLYTTILNS